MFRGLRPDEIEVRVGQITQKGASLLLYKDARCDMNILDETYGSMWWQRDHKEIKGNLYSGVSVYNDTLKEWVWKWDCGTESNTEKEKGEASDSFKRACFNLGIGRELYTSGSIFVPCETVKNKYDKYDLANKFMFYGAKVSKIEYAETDNKRVITSVEVTDKNGKVLYSSGKPVKTKPDAKKSTDDIPDERADAILAEAEATMNDPVTSEQLDMLVAVTKDMPPSTLSRLAKAYEVADLADLTRQQWAEAMEKIRKAKEKK